MTTEEISKVLHEHAKWLKGNGGKHADLCRADLHGADLYGADLSGADLYGADLYGANLCSAENLNIPLACPDTGSFIGWKKASGLIVKLLIPSDAKRLSATGRKCRCNKSKVLEIQNLDGSMAEVLDVRSGYDPNFNYRLGSVVKVDDFDENRWYECSTGIHFFITREEAVAY